MWCDIFRNWKKKLRIIFNFACIGKEKKFASLATFPSVMISVVIYELKIVPAEWGVAKIIISSKLLNCSFLAWNELRLRVQKAVGLCVTVKQSSKQENEISFVNWDQLEPLTFDYISLFFTTQCLLRFNDVDLQQKPVGRCATIIKYFSGLWGKQKKKNFRR